MKFMLSCKEVSQLVSQGLDSDLPFLSRIAIQFHFILCKNCARYRDQILSLRYLVRSVLDDYDECLVPEESSLSEDSRERMKLFLKRTLETS